MRGWRVVRGAGVRAGRSAWSSAPPRPSSWRGSGPSRPSWRCWCPVSGPRAARWSRSCAMAPRSRRPPESGRVGDCWSTCRVGSRPRPPGHEGRCDVAERLAAAAAEWAGRLRVPASPPAAAAPRGPATRRRPGIRSAASPIAIDLVNDAARRTWARSPADRRFRSRRLAGPGPGSCARSPAAPRRHARRDRGLAASASQAAAAAGRALREEQARRGGRAGRPRWASPPRAPRSPVGSPSHG